MESPWRRTFSFVFVIVYVNNVHAYSQHFPSGTGQSAPYIMEYSRTGYYSNSVCPDLQTSRATLDRTGQSPGSADTIGIGSYSQRSSTPLAEQLLYRLPKIIKPISPTVTPPALSPIAPVSQNTPNVPVVSLTQNSSPPPPLNPNTISPGQCNSGPTIPCPQISQSSKLYITALPNPNIINYNQQPSTPTPINQYISNASPIVPYSQTPPNVPSLPPFTPGLLNPNNDISVTQLQVLPISPQNFNDMGLIPFNSISVPPAPQKGLGVQFIPNPTISAPISQIEILPPAVPPYADPKFTPQPFYPNSNSIPPILPAQTYSLTAQFKPDTCNSAPPPVFLPPPVTRNCASFPLGQAGQTIYTNQQVFSPPYSFQPYTPNLEIPPQFPINTLPIVLPSESVRLPISGEENLPISLQINLPAVNLPPPSITIISTLPPNPSSAILETSDSVSLPYTLDNFTPFPTYSPPPIIIEGSKSKRKKWIPILIALFANRGCSNSCRGGCCCSSGNNIPIPFPIAVPTNNPIIVNNKKSNLKHNSDDSNDELKEDHMY